MPSLLPPSGVTPEAQGGQVADAGSCQTLLLQRGVEVSRRVMLAATTGGRLGCSFGPLDLTSTQALQSHGYRRD